MGAGNYAIVLNHLNGGGSQAEGGIKLIVTALSGTPSVKNAYANLTGMDGALEVNTPAKQ
ncbi:hypothetical protein D3C78_1847260 [compost metagenome]